MNFRNSNFERLLSNAQFHLLFRWMPVAVFCLGLFTLTACSSSKSGLTEGSEDSADTDVIESEGLGTFYIWVDSTRSAYRNATSEEVAYIGSGGDVIYSSSAPSGTAIIYAAESNSRIELTYVDMTSGASRILHVGRAPLVYTGAWSPDEQSFAFGYFVPIEGAGRSNIGAGEIMVLNRNSGRLQKAGCLSSQAVISWPVASTLVVRNNDNMYGVSPSDCTTQTTVDIRKWHSLTPSPDGQKIAYILRDLAYNKDSREYEPDSMLYVVPAGEEGGTLVVGERYRPRNVAWSASSSELAFDVLENLDEEKRVIFVYQIAEDTRFVLNDPSPSSPSESHPGYYGGSNTVYYLANGKNLIVGTASGNALFDLQIDEKLGKPVDIVQLPNQFTTLVEVDSGDVFLYSSQTKSSTLIGRGSAIIPKQ